mmetsp:Transcript_90938/g.291621  ORF Transcript_90938/g.291621 Transcript_90938/m.291621 type:complete len:97 (-) Transcript_90938:160-450(-)
MKSARGIAGSMVWLSFVFEVQTSSPQDGTTDLDRPSKHIFASSDCRELVEVPAVDPPLRFHSLVVERGGKVTRFREFVHFNSARFNLEYLVAYRRQ